VQLTVLDQSLWAATFLEDLILVFVLLLRGRVRRFPIFTALISLDIVRTIALLLIEHSGIRATYFYTYWSLALLDVVLQVGLVFRIAFHVFRPTGRWARDTVRGLIALVVVSLAIATILTWIPNPAVVLWLQIVLLKGNFFSALLLSELSVGIFALSVRAGLSWTTHVARIMQGFVAYSLCTLALETARTYFGVTQSSHVYDNLSHVRVVVYVLCMAYWIVTLWWNGPPPRVMTGLMRQQVSTIHQALAGRVEARRAEAKP
jgi:hypothetical protein